MANDFICSDCGGNGTRCECHKKRPARPWQPSEASRNLRERLALRAEWRKFGVDYKID